MTSRDDAETTEPRSDAADAVDDVVSVKQPDGVSPATGDAAIFDPLNPWIWPGLLIVVAAVLGWRVGDVTLVRSLAAVALLAGLLLTRLLPGRRVLGLVWSLVVAIGLLALLPWLDSVQEASADSASSHVDLSRVDLSGADLRGVSLSGATLRGAIFDGACLAGADFREADLAGATFRDADLTNAEWDDGVEETAAYWPTQGEIDGSDACR